MTHREMLIEAGTVAIRDTRRRIQRTAKDLDRQLAEAFLTAIATGPVMEAIVENAALAACLAHRDSVCHCDDMRRVLPAAIRRALGAGDPDHD